MYTFGFFTRMTKTEAVQVNLIYLIFNSSIFSGHYCFYINNKFTHN